MQKGKKFLSDLKLYSDYFKWRDELNRYENWQEACEDIINGHRKKYSAYDIEDYLSSALESMVDQSVLASQRNLQYRYPEIIRHNSRMFNCTSTHIMRNRVFQEIFYLGLSGCGVGGGLLLPFVGNLSKIQKRTLGTKTFIVPDSIEGWADALGVLMSSYFVDKQPFPEFAGYEVKFDYSQVREKGTYISGGFKAPGHEGLKQSLEKIEQLLEKWLDKEGNTIRPILAFDVICHASDAVLSGGVRRSALNMIVDPNDNEMIHAKVGNWREENPQRARSNNSVLLLRGKVTKEQFDYLVQLNHGDNDIGFVFANSWFDMFNPCFEILKIPVLDKIDFSKIDYEDVSHYVKNNEDKFGIQGCVSYDTKLITRNGIEIIGKVVNENREIEVWNGEKWSKVKPIKTGSNRILYRVKLNDGSYLDCTENHKWLVKNRFEKEFNEVETKDLINLLKTSKYKLQVPRSNVSDFDFGYEEKYAYDYGFVLGDGTCPKIGEKYRTPFASVYESNFSHEYPFVDGSIGRKLKEEYNGVKTEYYNVTFNKLDKEFSHKLKYDKGLPSEIFEWNKKSILAFVAGWIDTDGTITYNNKVRIYGEETKIRDLQLLLTKIGINSSVNLHSKKGFKTNIGERKRDLWYAQISDCGELWSIKSRFEKTEVKFKAKYQCIDSVEQLEGQHNSYCFEEQYKHQGVFNNVLTKQCNLTEINAEKATTKEKFFRACKDAAILGTFQAGYTSFPYLGKVSEEIFKREALLGVSITGWMNNPMLFNAELLKEGAEVVKKTNKELAEIIGINQAARTTCVKPSGNASVVLGTASGIHPEHSERYFRIMQLNKESNTAKWLTENMDFLLEDSVWSQTKSDYVVFVPVENPRKGLFKRDMKGVKHLELIKLVQQNWVNEGTNPEKCVYNPVNHNTSCFTGDVKFLTDEGVVSFDEIKNKEYVNVLNKNGNFSKSRVYNHGKQEIYELILGKGKLRKVINTTENHKWFIKRKWDRTLKGKEFVLETKNLEYGMKISSVNFDEFPEFNLDAFLHGVTFGDGTYHKGNDNCQTYLFDDSRCLHKYFELGGYSVKIRENDIRVHGLPNHWKKLPEIKTPDYIRSFIAGWFAADGHISKDGKTISISSVESDNLDWLQKNSCIGKVIVNQISQHKFGENPYSKSEYFYTITLNKDSLNDDFFKHDKKYDRWINYLKNKTQKSKKWKVLSVKKTNVFEDVYCVEEPITNGFVLEGNILTHNCTVIIDDKDAIVNYIWDNREDFTAVSFISDYGDKDFNQAPFTSVLNLEELVGEYGKGAVLASGLVVDGLHYFENNLWNACDTLVNMGTEYALAITGTREQVLLKKYWLDRAKKFAKNYFKGDIRKMVYCLKDVHLFHKWETVTRQFKEVNFREILNKPEYKDISDYASMACSGPNGSCEITRI